MKAKKEELTATYEEGQFFSRFTEMGGMDVSWESWPAGMDATMLFRGLPDDRCQCPHWGYLLKGQMRIKYQDREETIDAGEVYYLPPGHIPVVEKDCELIEFSPKGEYN